MGGRVSEGASHRKSFVDYMYKCAVFGINISQIYHIISKFSSQVSIYTHQKFQLRGPVGGLVL